MSRINSKISLVVGAFTFLLVAFHSAAYCADNRVPSTAWQDGRFNVNVAGVVGRSDIVLLRPNLKREEALPLGNGRLGIGVWSEGGLTVQLNRADTLPGRLSPGQVVLPGLRELTGAPDFKGRLDLYRGEMREDGNGLTALVYVQPDSDTVVIEVTGASPDSKQTATLSLWQPRTPTPVVHARTAILAETWKDLTEAGASGQTFGSLTAITADARDVRADPDGQLAVRLSFQPKPDGSFRLFIAAPEWKGGEEIKRSEELFTHIGKISSADHRRWWKEFWAHTGLMKLSSSDGSAEYFENLRCIDLFTAAAESLGPLPGSQAGIGDLFSAMRDEHKWDPSAYWHWNLRMQVAANIGAGLYRFNDSYFNLYRSNLQSVQSWTWSHMSGRPGVCVPETMRFNGPGYENETWLKEPGLNCTADGKPYYNARTLSTGAEVSLWVWQQYLAIQDRAFLAANYPLMAESARFLLAYGTRAADGTFHTYPSNAHETQWNVHDPATDIAAMRSLFPAVIEAARILRQDNALANQLQSIIGKLPLLPQTAGTSEAIVIAQSYDNDAPVHNTENIGLEPIFPYSIIGDTGPLHDIAVRTYKQRPNKFENDWSFDPLQAARLGLSDEMKLALVNLTEKYQEYPSGLAKFMGPEFYVEQIGVVAAALQEALVQDYDGLIRIAPAWPTDWDADGTVYIQQKSKVDVQMRHGRPMTVVIEAGMKAHMRLRNPWPGEAVSVVSGSEEKRWNESAKEPSTLDLDLESGQSYLITPLDTPNVKPPFAAIEGNPANKPKSFGTRHIGLP